MDTLRDKQVLEDLVEQGNMPWRLDRDSSTASLSVRQLKEIRDELNHAYAERTTPVVNAIITASPTR
jgi:hypothetical protein